MNLVLSATVLAVLPAAALVVIAAIAAAPAVIEGVKNILDVLGFDRSCIVEIVNATDEPLEIAVAETESGAFHDLPPRTIEPRSSIWFTAGSTYVGEGASGHTTVAGNRFHFFVDWSNPFVGSNDIDAEVGGERAAEFGVQTFAAGGETGAHLRCDFFYSNAAMYEGAPAPAPAPTIGAPFRFIGPPVAHNPNDHFVVTMGTRILVITNDGHMYGHDVNGTTIGEAFRLAGPPVAHNPNDHFVVTMGYSIRVITNEGQVWGHDVDGTTIGEAFRLAGPPVAYNPGDHFVVTMGHWIVVITNEGQVWGHAAIATIGEAFRFTGPPVAYNPGDHFVVAMGHWIVVITNEGQVWGHAAIATIGEAFRFTGPPVAYNPGDHFVVTMGTRILVITNDGQVWAHDVDVTTKRDDALAPTIGAAFSFTGPQVAYNANDHFVVTMGHRILVITNDGQVWGNEF
jgi:hypothetical protein